MKCVRLVWISYPLIKQLMVFIGISGSWKKNIYIYVYVNYQEIHFPLLIHPPLKYSWNVVHFSASFPVHLPLLPGNDCSYPFPFIFILTSFPLRFSLNGNFSNSFHDNYSFLYNFLRSSFFIALLFPSFISHILYYYVPILLHLSLDY